MPRILRRHLACVATLLREGLWGRWLGAVYAVAGPFVFIRDDWWRPSNASKGKLVAMIPHFTWEQWALGALAIALFWTFEASYRVYWRREDRIRELEGIMASPLEIVFDPNNANRSFWSMENNTNPIKPDEHIVYWEYRIR